MSATHFSFGRVAVKSRCSRSRTRSSAASSTIVVRRFLPRRTPSGPARASAGRRGRGRPRPRDASAPSRSCGRRRRAGSPRGRRRSPRRASDRRAHGGRLPGPARVVRAHRHADRLAEIGSTPKTSRRSSTKRVTFAGSGRAPSRKAEPPSRISTCRCWRSRRRSPGGAGKCRS